MGPSFGWMPMEKDRWFVHHSLKCFHMRKCFESHLLFVHSSSKHSRIARSKETGWNLRRPLHETSGHPGVIFMRHGAVNNQRKIVPRRINLYFWGGAKFKGRLFNCNVLRRNLSGKQMKTYFTQIWLSPSSKLTRAEKLPPSLALRRIIWLSSDWMFILAYAPRLIERAENYGWGTKMIHGQKEIVCELRVVSW